MTVELELGPKPETYPAEPAPNPLERAWLLSLRLPLFARYILVTGVIGLPASIVQLWALVHGYGALTGDVNTIELNALWIVNFEIGLLRNYGMLCAYTWQAPPTWQRTRHAHVAASGALVIDLIAFNAVVYATGIIPLAQLVGATAGFAFNYTYNSLKTFTRAAHAANGA
jgi:putative flippase GtrA